MDFSVIPSPATLAGLDPDLRTAMAGLVEVAVDSAKAVPDFGGMIYKDEPFPANDKKIVKSIYGGLPAATVWPGTVQEIRPVSRAKMYDITAILEWYGNSALHLLDTIEHDKYRLTEDSVELGKSAAEKDNLLAWAPFIDGSTTTFWDGVPFFSASHKMDPRMGGDVQSNLVVGALNPTNVFRLIKLCEDTRDPLGRTLNLMPKRWWCDVNDKSAVKEILNIGQAMKSGTANNDRNPFGDYEQTVQACPYLKGANMLILEANETWAKRNLRVKPRMTMVNQPNHGVKHDVRFETVYWIERWYGFYALTW